MKQTQMEYLIKNNYKVIDGKIINTLNALPPIEIIYDNDINKFCLGIRMLKIYENDINSFSKLLDEFKEIINTLNKL